MGSEDKPKRNQANEPAMPLTHQGCLALENGYYFLGTGLTKREYFAAKAMQGMIQNNDFYLDAIPKAVKAADSLLKALEDG